MSRLVGAAAAAEHYKDKEPRPRSDRKDGEKKSRPRPRKLRRRKRAIALGIVEFTQSGGRRHDAAADTRMWDNLRSISAFSRTAPGDTRRVEILRCPGHAVENLTPHDHHRRDPARIPS